MAIETSRNNCSVKISKNSSHKLSIHEQGSGNSGEPTRSASGFSYGHAPSCMPTPTGVAERLFFIVFTWTGP